MNTFRLAPAALTLPFFWRSVTWSTTRSVATASTRCEPARGTPSNPYVPSPLSWRVPSPSPIKTSYEWLCALLTWCRMWRALELSTCPVFSPTSCWWKTAMPTGAAVKEPWLSNSSRRLVLTSMARCCCIRILLFPLGQEQKSPLRLHWPSTGWLRERTKPNSTVLFFTQEGISTVFALFLTSVAPRVPHRHVWWSTGARVRYNNSGGHAIILLLCWSTLNNTDTYFHLMLKCLI